jgi:hypothetical protein
LPAGMICNPHLTSRIVTDVAQRFNWRLRKSLPLKTSDLLASFRNFADCTPSSTFPLSKIVALPASCPKAPHTQAQAPRAEDISVDASGHDASTGLDRISDWIRFWA